MRSATLRRSSLYRRSLYQPREPAFWVFVGIVGIGAVQILSVLSRLSQISTSGYALSWLLLALYAVPMFILVYSLDLYEHEPLSLAFGAFAWGAFAATWLALLATGWDQLLAQVFGTGFTARWGTAITAPLTEETMKAAGVVLIYLIAREEMDDVMDGFVYGALCGLGFAVVEDVVYFMGLFGGRPAEVLQGFYVRVLSSGLYGHVLYTGLIGMGIGYVVTRRTEVPLAKRLKVAAWLCVAGVGMHALWNSPLLDFAPADPHGASWLLVPVGFAVKGIPMITLVAIAVYLARGRERRWLDAALEHEIALGGITANELEVLRVPKRRRAAVRDMRRRAGRGAASVLKRLQREQITLAMIASRVATPDDPALVEQRAYCSSLRDALAATPGAAPPEPPLDPPPPTPVAPTPPAPQGSAG